MPIMIVIVLIESFVCSEIQYVRNLSSVSSAAERIEEIRLGQPSVAMSAVCYYYETRTRSIHYTDADGTKKRGNVRRESHHRSHSGALLLLVLARSIAKNALGHKQAESTKNQNATIRIFGDSHTADDFHNHHSRFQDEKSASR